jgi:hypothetical protein
MATVPSTLTAAVGDRLEASDWNTYVRDAVAFFLDPPQCYVYNNANISVATSGTAQALTFNTEIYDTDAMHSTSSNTDRITIVTAGYYVLVGNVIWAANATGVRELAIQRNGTTVWAIRDTAVAAGEAHIQDIVTPPLLASATDYFQLFARQTSGGALNATTAAYSPSLSARWVSST